MKELIRDPISLITLFLVPVSMMVVFGYGLKLDVKGIPFTVVDYSNSKQARELVSSLAGNKEYFKFKGYAESEEEALKELKGGKVSFFLVFPESFEKSLKEGKRAQVGAFIDGTFPYRAEVIKSYLKGFSLSKSTAKGKVDVRLRYWFNESLNQDFIVAVGTIGIVLLISPAVFSALLIVKEKESGTIYNAYSSPITPLEFLTGKLLSGILLSIPIYFLVYLMVVFLFKAPMKGSFFVLTVGSLIYLAVSVSFGLLLSNFFSSQAAAFIGTTVLTIVPSILYSGYMTPVSSMERSALITAHLVPTFYYLKFLKGLFFKGAPLGFLLRELIPLVGFFVALFGLSLLTFKKREK